MRTRVLILVIALLFGGLAAFMAGRYMSDARTKIAAESEPVEVLVAQDTIPRGLTSEELISQGLIELEQVPRRFVAADAVSSARKIQGQVLATQLSEGQQVTASQFQVPSTAGLAFSIPDGQQAIAIPVTEVSGVAGLVKPGDRIALYVTFSPGPAGEPDFTRILLADVKVLAVGSDLSSEPAAEEERTGGLTGNAQGTQDAVRTLTIAVTSADAERLVFAEQTGEIWCSLLPANAPEQGLTPGQSLETVLR